MQNRLLISIFLWVVLSQLSHAQIPAMLPNVKDTEPGEASQIDGLWSISTIDKLVRIDRGRIYAVDSWLHLFVLKVTPGMVIVHPFKLESAGVFVGYDLPLQGELTGILSGDRLINVTVQGAFGEIKYQLIPRELDNPEAFDMLFEETRFIGR